MQIDTTRTSLTPQEIKFNADYQDKGIEIVSPAQTFKDETYDYALRDEKLKSLSIEHLLLVATANKLGMCIRANDFIFAPPQSKSILSKEILTALKTLIDKVLS